MVTKQVQHNLAIKAQKMARGLKVGILEEERLYYPCSENKDADCCVITAQLICVFVLAYAQCWFSHDVAQISSSEGKFSSC